jgi:hypothetical protein
MFKLLKESFYVTNDCIILATPLIVFLSIGSWYYNYLLASADAIAKIILGGITLLIMTCAFLSAWLYMSKKVIALSNKIFVFDRDRAKALLNIILSSPKGIGKLCIPILFVILTSLLIFVADYFIFLKFKIIAIILGIFFTYIILFWLGEIVYIPKKPIQALKYTILNLIKDWKNSLSLFLYIGFWGGLIFTLNILFAHNPILYFFVLLLFYYFLVYLTVLLFMYHEQRFNKN